jgi:hypothetical protein
MEQKYYLVRYIIILTMCMGSFLGCGSVAMQKASFVNTTAENTLITFVRPSVFMGDGVRVDIWDGEHFVGTLGAGTLVQYETQAGEHLFLANAENWSYVSANVLAGKKYTVKANIFPGVWYARVALTPVPTSDSRIEGWLSKLTPMAANSADAQSVEVKKQEAIRAAIADFRAGKATFSQMRPEDGL